MRRVGFGVEEAALSAADRWRFRPARHGGRVVQTYYTLTFRFGV
ncbi:MAG: energy transducer TonB [Rhodothermia bacterium]